MSNEKIQLPEKIFVKNLTDNQGTFIIKPLEQSFGHAIGNALRRTLLSSIPGYAITHVKWPKGVKHMFDNIAGVKEDITKIVLNLKQVVFKEKKTEEKKTQKKITIHVKVKSGTILYARDLVKENNLLEVCNPDHIILNAENAASFSFELIIQKGHRYMLAIPENVSLEKLEGFDNIDALFSPIKNVSYLVKDARVAGRVDYEAVEITITTDGSVSPKFAIEEAAYCLIQHFSKILQHNAIIEEKNPTEYKKLDQMTIKIQRALRKTVNEMDFPSRAKSIFRLRGFRCLLDVVKLKEAELDDLRNFGAVTKEQVKKKLAELGMSFGMDLSPYQLDGEDDL